MSDEIRTPWRIQKAVVFALFIRELKTRFGHFKGGYLWLLAEPLAHVTILSALFSFVRQGSLFAIDLPVFLVTGIVPFLLLKNITLRVMDGVDRNRGLFGFRQIKPMDTFIARTLLESLLAAVVFMVLLSGMAWLGMDIPFRNPLGVFFVFLGLSIAGLGLGVVYAVAIYYLPEAKVFLRLTFLPLYLLSGVIFPISSLPYDIRNMLLANPMLHAIEVMRVAFFTEYHLVNGVSVLFPVLSALTLLLIGLALYRTHRYKLVSL